VLTGEGREGERRERLGGTRGAVGGGGTRGPFYGGKLNRAAPLFGLLGCCTGEERRKEKRRERKEKKKGREKEKEKEFFSKLGNF
jgi:hypothetical protein